MRTAVLGNSCLYLGFDSALRLREMFWPVVGLANHVAEEPENRLLLWYQGQILYIGGENWETKTSYREGMVCEWDLHHRFFPVKLTVTDAVDPVMPLWQRKLDLVLTGEDLMQIGIYSKQYYNLGENDIGECAFWDPYRLRLYHYKGPYWVAIGFLTPRDLVIKGPLARVAKRRDGGVKIQHNGDLEGQVVDHGLIESVLGFKTQPGSRSGQDFSFSCTYNLALGHTQKECDSILDSISEGLDRDQRGQIYARKRSIKWWSMKLGLSCDRESASELYDISLKVLFSHFDRNGGVLASLDQDIMGDYRDHYRYVWPRDAAMCVSALCRAGYPGFAREYLSFCEKAVTGEGFFWQRYRPDFTRGSGWHPHNLPQGELPIQEDETALSLLSAKDYLEATGDLDFMAKIYPTFISKAARFLINYTQDGGKLVKPSFDLWEERRGVFAYTQAACVASLYGAYEIAWILGEPDAAWFLEEAVSLHQGLLEHLSDDELGFFRGFSDSRVRDQTPDASLSLIPVFFSDFLDTRDDNSLQNELKSCFKEGLPDGKREVISTLINTTFERSLKTWNRIDDSLKVFLPGGRALGIARYQGDWYMRPANSQHIPGNPWFVTTSWYLQAYMLLNRLKSQGNLFDGENHLSRAFSEDICEKGERFFSEFCLKSGILSEQVNGVTGEPLSCAPLAWSHAAYIDLIQMKRKLRTE